MKIAIIGAGMIGGTMSRLLVGAGHEVAISNRRGPDSLRDLLSELGVKARWANTDEASQWADVVLLAVPWRNPEALPSPESVRGKIVIDAMNPYTAGGGIQALGDSSSSEETAKRLPGARLVKAFNTIYFVHLEKQGRKDLPEDDRRAIFVAGDDAEAKAVVMDLIRQIGFAPVDMGSLRDGKKQEPNTPVYNREISRREALKLLTA